jgi:hypothetical protein
MSTRASICAPASNATSSSCDDFPWPSVNSGASAAITPSRPTWERAPAERVDDADVGPGGAGPHGRPVHGLHRGEGAVHGNHERSCRWGHRQEVKLLCGPSELCDELQIISQQGLLDQLQVMGTGLVHDVTWAFALYRVTILRPFEVSKSEATCKPPAQAGRRCRP